MEEKIIELYQNIEHFKYLKKYFKDLEILNNQLLDFDHAQAIQTISHYLQKYYKSLTKIGSLLGGVKLVYDATTYKTKTNDDLIDDIYFCMLGVLCDAYISIGLCDNASNFVLKYYLN